VNPSELFMLYSADDIAQQMTIVDFGWWECFFQVLSLTCSKRFQDIESRELLNQCWSKPKLQYRAGFERFSCLLVFLKSR
jgi:hypothetical protein